MTEADLSGFSKRERELLAQEYRHIIEVRDGVFTKGKNPVVKSLSYYPFDKVSFKDQRLMDIGCWAGGFGFQFEKWGADLVSLDVMDPSVSKYDKLHELLGSSAQFLRKTIYELDPSEDGVFDIIFFQGVFYHLKHPLLALEKLNALLPLGGRLIGAGTTGNYSFFHENKTVLLNEEHPALEEVPMSFFVRDSYLQDKTNWFIPNGACVEAWLKRSGFDCDWIETSLGHRVAEGTPVSVTRFIAKKVSEPEMEHDLF